MKNRNMTEPLTEQGRLAEVRLWQAVVVRAIQEWKSGPLRSKREAERYLFEDDSDFALVCRSAGIDFGRLRAKLAKLRTEENRNNCGVAA